MNTIIAVALLLIAGLCFAAACESIADDIGALEAEEVSEVETQKKIFFYTAGSILLLCALAIFWQQPAQ